MHNSHNVVGPQRVLAGVLDICHISLIQRIVCIRSTLTWFQTHQPYFSIPLCHRSMSNNFLHWNFNHILSFLKARNNVICTVWTNLFPIHCPHVTWCHSELMDSKNQIHFSIRSRHPLPSRWLIYRVLIYSSRSTTLPAEDSASSKQTHQCGNEHQ